MRQKYIIHTKIEKIMKIKMIKTCKLPLIRHSKSCYQVCHTQIITKILKNETNIKELAVRIEESSFKRLHSRSKLS